MTFSQFLMAYFKAIHNDNMDADRVGRRPLRQGQILANLLRDVRPDLADMLRGSALDPFYDDAVRHDSFMWICDHWGYKYEADLYDEGVWAEIADVAAEVLDDSVG